MQDAKIAKQIAKPFNFFALFKKSAKFAVPSETMKQLVFKVRLNMVSVVQLVEHRIVVPSVVGSSPITHPKHKSGPVGSLFVSGEWGFVMTGRGISQTHSVAFGSGILLPSKRPCGVAFRFV